MSRAKTSSLDPRPFHTSHFRLWMLWAAILLNFGSLAAAAIGGSVGSMFAAQCAETGDTRSHCRFAVYAARSSLVNV
ncbi:hypothetical protein FB451DRAFT_1387099 [Mycena latifolia]|nr:hypothetical protein FB451DRAFT_1387094 [Mycena latifolia]KAJ7495000.1 hypothetical protein FB451DRAFT_1387099 [Mycena latifolia]